MQVVMHPSPARLGFLGVGASKEEAVAAYEAAALMLQETLKKSLMEFPKAAAALNMWPKVVAEEKQFWADRQDTIESSKGITFWGDRIEAADKYKARWEELAKQVAAKALEINEQSKTPGYSPFPPEPKDEGGFPWAIVGGVVVVGVVIALAVAKKSGKLAGLRRRRRSR